MDSMETLAKLSFAPDGKSISGSGTWSDRVRTFDVANGSPIHELSLSGIRGWSLGTRLASGLGWEPKEEIGFATLGHSPNGRSLVAVGYNTDRDIRVRKWNLSNRTEQVGHNLTMRGFVQKTGDSRYEMAWPSAEALSADRKVLAVAHLEIKLIDVETGGVVATLKPRDGGVVGLAFSPDGKQLAAITYSEKTGGAIRIWEWRTQNEQQTVARETKGSWYMVRFSPAGDRIAALRFNEQKTTVTIWSTATWEPVFSEQRGAALFFTFAWAPDGNRLAVGNRDGTIELWDMAAMEAR
jgi:WD40 repeat protein